MWEPARTDWVAGAFRPGDAPGAGEAMGVEVLDDLHTAAASSEPTSRTIPPETCSKASVVLSHCCI